MRKIELLAPAGTKEAFVGAINAGADAVYLAGKKFGARATATNFEEDELVEAIHFAHLRNAKVYVTINTLIYDDEIDELIEYTDFLVQNHIDALIIQDLGLMDILSHRYPDTDLHASTQVNTLNVDQAMFIKSLGMKRIILARETSIDTIKAIRQAVDIELEVFVHGALCVSYSGNCLFSSMIGGRSGNRGECAQPCRLPYTLLKNDEIVDESAYLMSTKDLMTIERLGELIDAGVASMKIEGRMRKPEYVIQTVSSYIKAIEHHIGSTDIVFEDEIVKLKKVFNRGYTEGYLFNAIPKTINNPFRPNHMGIEIGTVIQSDHGKITIELTEPMQVGDGIRFIGEKDFGLGVSRIIKADSSIKRAFGGETVIIDSPEEVAVGSKVLKTQDSELEASLAPFLDWNHKSIFLKGIVSARVGEPLQLDASDGLGNEYSIKSTYVIEKANSKPVLIPSMTDQFSKLGNTPFEWKDLMIESDEQGFIPVKVMNDLRRDMIDLISQTRTNRPVRKIIETIPSTSESFEGQDPEIIVQVLTIDQFNAAIESGIKKIYVNDTLKLQNTNFNDVQIVVKKRRIWRNTDNSIEKNDLVVSDIGHLFRRKELRKTVTDEFFNVTNIFTANLLYKNGAKSVTLSPEMTKKHLETYTKNFFETFNYRPDLEKIVYGHEELMISKYCPIAKTYDTSIGCDLCHQNQYYLKDRMGATYPLINDGICNIKVMHSKPLNLVDYLSFFIQNGINGLRLNFSIEDYEKTKTIITAYQKAMRQEPYYVNRDNVTTGRFLR